MKKFTGSSVKILNTMQRKTKATDNIRNGHNAEFNSEECQEIQYDAQGSNVLGKTQSTQDKFIL
jgi:hypothetical protein